MNQLKNDLFHLATVVIYLGFRLIQLALVVGAFALAVYYLNGESL